MGFNGAFSGGGGGGGGGAPGPQGPEGPQGEPGPGLPTGGTAGQYPRKSSGTDYATEWATASQTRTDLGLGTAATEASSAFQAADPTLTALAGVTTGADLAPYFTGTDTAGTFTLTAFGRTLLDDADASAARTTLGLGTAAVANTGTANGNVVVLGADGLPAVSGANLTGLPGPYAADAWEYEWTAAEGAMSSSGWTAAGTGAAMTDVAATIGGVDCRTLTPPAGASSSYLYHDVGTPPVGSYEWRALVYLPASTSTAFYGVNFSTSAAGINKRFTLAVDSSALEWYTASSTFNAAAAMGGLVNRWLWLTMRVQNGGSGAPGFFQLWLGGVLVDSGSTAAGTDWRAISTAGRIEVGKTLSFSGTSAMSVAVVQYRGGFNEAPPDYTLRALAGAPGP